jgi:hypothetical protein
LTALSLLVCLATGMLWARSYWALDQIVRTEADSSGFGLRSCRGSIVLWYREVRGFVNVPDQWNFESGPVNNPIDIMPLGLVRWSGLGFYSSYIAGAVASGFPPIHDEYLCIPYWALSVATAIPLAAGFFRWRRRRVIKRQALRGHCPNCNYDLRATPERCPECGHVPVGA